MNYLTGKQIELRAVEPEDLDALYRWENDSSLWIYGSTVSPFSRYLLKQYIENYTADITRDKQLRLIIMRKESRQVIGAIDCFDYDTTNRKAAIGAFMFMRRETLDKSGLLDESFFMYGEDIDLSYRLVLAGYTNYFLPTPIIHYKGESTKKGSLRYVRVFYEAMLIFFKKHYPHYSKGYYLAVKSSIFFRASLAAAYRAVSFPFHKHGKTDKKEKGKWYILSRTPQTIARLIPGIKHYTPIWSADEIPSSSERQDDRHIILDSGLLSYREIIETIQSKSDVRNHFLIYTPDSEIIISPQQTYTKP